METLTQHQYLILKKIYILLFLLLVMVVVIFVFLYKSSNQKNFIVLDEDNIKIDKEVAYYFSAKNVRINIVYFANFFENPTYGIQLVKHQLKDLVDTGLLSVATLHLVFSTPTYQIAPIRKTLSSLFHRSHNIFFHFNHEDCYIYPGIQLVYSLSVVNNFPFSYILFFYARNMETYRGKREPIEKALHKTVIQPWKHMLKIFDTHPKIDKIGSSASKKGWIWFNYWWARVSYLVKVEPPMKTLNNDYYEQWLSYLLKDPYQDVILFNNKNCWSLSMKKNHVGKWCHKKEAIKLLL